MSQRSTCVEPPTEDLPHRGLLKDIEPEMINYKFGNIDNYELCSRIGRGKYSTVFSGVTASGRQCVLKVLKPMRANKIYREIKILQLLKDCPNTSKLIDVVKDQESEMVTLVLEWTNDDFRNVFATFDLKDIAIYTFKVLQALEYAHSHGIMHRDVKPQNIMIDHTKKVVSLIDWGLADLYVPGQQYQVRVATRNYKSPELLFGYSLYTPSIDIWGLGCTLATMLTKRSPFFRGRDNVDLIIRISDFVGCEEIENYLKKYNITIQPDLYARIAGHKRRADEFVMRDDSKNFISPAAFDLLMKMLTVDHIDRISATEALAHPFFDEIREQYSFH